MSEVDVDAVKHYFEELQDRICNALADLDGAADFVEDSWIWGLRRSWRQVY